MKRKIITLTGAAVLAGLSLGTAPTAQATSDTTTIVCDAAQVRSQPEQSASANGVAYRGDSMRYDQWVYKESEGTWYTRGTVTRTDGATIKGYVLYDCANPYQARGAKTPPIPK